MLERPYIKEQIPMHPSFDRPGPVDSQPEKALPIEELFREIPELPKVHQFGFNYHEDLVIIEKWLGAVPWESHTISRAIEKCFDLLKQTGLPPSDEGIKKSDLPYIWLVFKLGGQCSDDELRTILNNYKLYRARLNRQKNTPPEAEVIRREIARVLQVRMGQMRVSTHQLAEKSREQGRQYALSQRTISNMLNDTDSNPTLTNLIKLADVLEIDLWQLLKPRFADALRDGEIDEKDAATAEEVNKLKEDVLMLNKRLQELVDKIEWEELMK